MYIFPNHFLIGASTAAHQVEGNNVNSDFWLMESLEASIFAERSGDAVDHYHLYREDIAMLADFGLNAFRFSIEWARIEPEEGVYDETELEHYRDVLRACKEYRVTPIVTMHHFTSPQWLIRDGGWESEKTPARFARYCAFVMRELGEMIPYVCTINEANIAIGIAKFIEQQGSAAQVGVSSDSTARMQDYYAQLGSAFGIPPNDIHSFLTPRSEKGLHVIFQAHTEARTAIRQERPDTKIGMAMSLHDVQSVPGGEALAQHAWQEELLQFLPYIKGDDFFGLQNYTREVYGPDGIEPVSWDADKTQMGYEFYPQGLESVIRFAAKHLDMPIIVTENGVATDNDERRIDFINRALKGVQACIADGILVDGYMHWSLLDNFEWHLGFSKRFGLVAVDRSTQLREPKPSAYYLGNIAKTKILY